MGVSEPPSTTTTDQLQLWDPRGGDDDPDEVPVKVTVPEGVVVDYLHGSNHSVCFRASYYLRPTRGTVVVGAIRVAPCGIMPRSGEENSLYEGEALRGYLGVRSYDAVASESCQWHQATPSYH